VAEGGGEEQATGAHSGTPDVFVSYASQDAAVANSVVESLEQHAFRCWIAPRDVVPGSLYADEIVHAINVAKIVVLVLSEHAVASPHVGKEIERASSKRRRIIAFHTDSAPLTGAFEYFLSESQWIDVAAEGTDAAAAKLVEAVRRHLDPSSVAEPHVHSHLPVASGAAAAPRMKWMVVGIVAILLLALAYFVADRLWLSKDVAEEKPAAAVAPAAAPAAHAIPEKSVAVLPFVDMSEKKDQEYFSDGLSEELIDMLTKMPELRVPARTSSFYFKGKQTTIAEIAKSLGVANVLEGSVRKSANTLRITAQLIRVDSGYHVWSETYDRQLDDIFKIQDEIAGAVVKALKVSLLEGGVARATPTSNTEAYTLYLQGQAIGNNAAQSADVERAIDHLQRALKLDPMFARAWAALAGWRVFNYSYFTNGNYQQVLTEARFAAEQALKLDPNLSDAHAAMSDVYSLEWNWKAADAEINKAITLDPGNADVLGDASQIAQTLGRFEEALQLAQRAAELDPLGEDVGSPSLASGRLAEAEAAFRQAIDLAPRRSQLHFQLGWVLLARREPAAALAEMERETDERYREVGRALALDALGRKSDADRALAVAKAKYAGVVEYPIAVVYANRNDLDMAFEWLDRAYQLHDGWVSWAPWDPLLKNLRGDPRYKAFLRKINLPE
jgi:TolB-like protein/Flp pilus assembly protein TadD